MINPYLISEQEELEGKERDKLTIVKFDFKEQLMDLLEDSDIFGNVHNLVVNKDEPFRLYNSKSNKAEMNDGDWYKERADSLRSGEGDQKFDEDHEFFVPLVLYCDKTGTSDNQRYPLEPFIFTTSVIKSM